MAFQRINYDTLSIKTIFLTLPLKRIISKPKKIFDNRKIVIAHIYRMVPKYYSNQLLTTELISESITRNDLCWKTLICDHMHICLQTQVFT